MTEIKPTCAGRCWGLTSRSFRRSLISVGLALLSACTSPPDSSLRMALQSGPITLDPRFATDATSARINRLLYRRLVDFDGAFRPVPALARWVRLAPTHYRFTLGEQGRRFHDGSPLDAGDVKATYAFILDPDNGSPHRATLSLITRIDVLDRDTVDFHLTRADPLFPGYLVIGILPRRLIAAGHPFQRQPVGSGPFRIQDWPSDNRLILVRERDQQAFAFLRIPDPTVRVLKLLRGEVDLLQNDLLPELVGYLGDSDGVAVRRDRGTNFTYLGFNLADPVTGKKEIREAIAYAIDREAIIHYVLGEAARPANALLPPEHWAGHPKLGAYEHDPQRARALLQASGFGPQKPLTLTYKTSSDPFRIRLATILQSQLAEVGIQVDLRSYDWGTFYGDIKAGRFQMYSLSWVGIKTPDIFRYIFHSTAVPPNGANRGRFASPMADRLIEAAEASQALSDQAQLYRRLQAHLLVELPYVPLWYEDHVVATREGIMGYAIAPDGNYDGLNDVERKPGGRYLAHHESNARSALHTN